METLLNIPTIFAVGFIISAITIIALFIVICDYKLWCKNWTEKPVLMPALIIGILLSLFPPFAVIIFIILVIIFIREMTRR